MSKSVFIVLCALAFSACGSNHMLSPLTAPPGPSSATVHSTLVPVMQASIITHTGSFTEYTLPAGLRPKNLVNGAGTVWFTPCNDTGGWSTASSKIYRMSTSTGTVTMMSPSSAYDGAEQCLIASIGGYFWYILSDPNAYFNDILARVTPSGSFAYYQTGQEQAPVTNMVQGSDGRLWAGFCFDSCVNQNGGALQAFSLSGARGTAITLTSADKSGSSWYGPISLTSGPSGYLYATAYNAGMTGTVPNYVVFKVSTTGTILNRFALPNASNAAAIRKGPDGNLWIAEPGLNQIVRMTAYGVIKAFTVPTANAGVRYLTVGADGALWFTETNANKIGRLTTLGAFTEHLIPTASSHPAGIIPCPTTVCGTRGGVWFTEPGANKVARFNF